MTYDLLIKNGRIVDGSGAAGFRGDIGVRNGKISEIGKLRGNAKEIVDADGLVVAPGFIDTHCHYDAQVTWDPLCSFSCNHGATTVIIGNCSLALAPVRPKGGERLCEFLSYVEAIPMEALRTVNVTWESIAQYMDALDKRLGVNVGVLVGHTAVRHYVMGDESQGRTATNEEIQAMKEVVRGGIKAGALGLSISRNKGHYDPQGNQIPALWAEEDEIFALGDVLGELGTGIIQCGQGRGPEMRNRMMSRLSEATGRQVVYNNLNHNVKQPDEWKKHIAVVDEAAKAGIRANPMCTPNSHVTRYNMHNTQEFRGVPTWHPILIASDEEKLRAYSDPAVRKKLHNEVVEWMAEIPESTISRNWADKTFVEETVLKKNKVYEGKSISELAKMQGKGIIDAFLDLVVEENLDTQFYLGASNSDREIMKTILTYPHAYIGLSDGGAHVQYHGGYGYSSRLLGHWVRQEGIMSLEQAVKRLTFESALLYGIYDRGLLRPGFAADITIFDPDTIRSMPEDKVEDFPAGSWRVRELAAGIHYTIVNGRILLRDGVHSGALPGRVLRNSLYCQ